MLRTIANGGGFPETKMPAFGDKHPDAQMVAILEFIKTSWGPDERQFQREATVREVESESSRTSSGRWNRVGLELRLADTAAAGTTRLRGGQSAGELVDELCNAGVRRVVEFKLCPPCAYDNGKAYTRNG